MLILLVIALIFAGTGQFALAGDPAPFSRAAPTAVPGSTYTTVVHPAPGIDYYYDNRGNSTTTYETSPGIRAYTSRGPDNRITAQGNLYDLSPRLLELPPVTPLPQGFYDPPTHEVVR
jgi:hypothetical protein